MSAWVVLGVDDPGNVGAWRLEAERAMAAAGRPGMTDEQVPHRRSGLPPWLSPVLPWPSPVLPVPTRTLSTVPGVQVRLVEERLRRVPLATHLYIPLALFACTSHPHLLPPRYAGSGLRESIHARVPRLPAGPL
jgi:hypothetical protein